MSPLSPEAQREIARRRTFAIISHPDAGKTTVTEKLLLFGNAIHMAGVVKAKRATHFARSDWMEIEKQRGISVTSSVMQFDYEGACINLLDTPGHQDFSEDTYRVLTAVDSALMIIDSSKGIEAQTKKLFQVCHDRRIPIITFMNKMDLEGRDPFELIDEVEKVLHLPCAPLTWPIGQGSRFAGVFDRVNHQVRLFDAGRKTTDFEQDIISNLEDPRLIARCDEDVLTRFHDDAELLGAGNSFDEAAFLRGEQTPVFFGSAVNNFGIQELLETFIRLAPPPRPREAMTRTVQSNEKPFTGLVFKIQANMDPKHRDRCAFIRICSGKFEPGMDLWHVREKRPFRIHNAIRFLSQDREHVENAYAGDIIGVTDRGNLRIGDTLTEGEELQFTGIPQFSPDIFSRVDLKNPIKIKQLHKGLEQLAEEGSSQIFRRKHNSESLIGVVGNLQLEVVKFRLMHEYGADAVFTTLPYSLSCWFHADERKTLEDFTDYYQNHIVYDVRGDPLILFKSEWEKDYIAERNPKILFSHKAV